MKDQSINHPGILVGLLVDGRFLKTSLKWGKKRCNRSKEKKKKIPQSFVSHKAPCHSLFWDKEIFCFSILFSPSSEEEGKEKMHRIFSVPEPHSKLLI